MTNRRTRTRRGTVLIAALVCMVVVMAMIGVMLQGTLRARRQLHTERNLRQCEFLLQAGIQRAAQRLAMEADYRRETWKLPPEAIIGNGGGEVVIEASRAADTEPWQLHVVAEYPTGSETSIRRSHSLLVRPDMPRAQE